MKLAPTRAIDYAASANATTTNAAETAIYGDIMPRRHSFRVTSEQLKTEFLRRSVQLAAIILTGHKTRFSRMAILVPRLDPNSTTRTPATDMLYSITNGQAYSNSTTCCTTNSPPPTKICHIAMTEPNISTCQDVVQQVVE